MLSILTVVNQDIFSVLCACALYHRFQFEYWPTSTSFILNRFIQTNKQGWSPEAVRTWKCVWRRNCIKLNKTMLSQKKVLSCFVAYEWGVSRWNNDGADAMQCSITGHRRERDNTDNTSYPFKSLKQYDVGSSHGNNLGHLKVIFWHHFLTNIDKHCSWSSEFRPPALGDDVLWRLRPEPYFPRILPRSPSTLRGFGVAGEWRPSFLKVTLWTHRKMFQISF